MSLLHKPLPTVFTTATTEAEMITRRIACVSIFISLSSWSGISGSALAAPVAFGQPAINSIQQQTTYSKEQDDSTPRQGLPGRRISGGTRHHENYE